MTSTSNNANESKKRSASRNTYLSQSDVPGYSIREAMRIPQALADSFGKTATKPLLVSQAVGISPTSGKFRMLCGASIGYSLTDGGYNANKISLTTLGMRVVAPQVDGDDLVAMREAFLQPRVINKFLTKYQNSKLPSDEIARNVLEGMGVPTKACARAFVVIKTGAEELGLFQNINGQIYVDIEMPNIPSSNDPVEDDSSLVITTFPSVGQAKTAGSTQSSVQPLPVSQAGYRTFTIPLTGGRTGGIQLPPSIDNSDLQRIKKWLDLMEDVLTEPESLELKQSMGSNPEVASPLMNEQTDSEDS